MSQYPTLHQYYTTMPTNMQRQPQSQSPPQLPPILLRRGLTLGDNDGNDGVVENNSNNNDDDDEDNNNDGHHENIIIDLTNDDDDDNNDDDTRKRQCYICINVTPLILYNICSLFAFRKFHRQ